MARKPVIFNEKRQKDFKEIKEKLPKKYTFDRLGFPKFVQDTFDEAIEKYRNQK